MGAGRGAAAPDILGALLELTPAQKRAVAVSSREPRQLSGLR